MDDPNPEMEVPAVLAKQSLFLRVVQSLSQTPILLLQIFAIWWLYILAVSHPDGLDEALQKRFLKALGIGIIVGSVHCANAYWVWVENQTMIAKLLLEKRRVKRQRQSDNFLKTSTSDLDSVLNVSEGDIDVSFRSYVATNLFTICRFYAAPICVSTYSYTMRGEDFTFIFPIGNIGSSDFSKTEVGFLVCICYSLSIKTLEYLYIWKPSFDARNRPQGESSVEPLPWWSNIIIKHTNAGYLLLWSVFLFWVFTLATQLARGSDAHHKFPTSIGLALVIGFVLNVNAYAMFKGNRQRVDRMRQEIANGVEIIPEDTSIMRYLNANAWSVIRFFLIPFCVSTYTIVMAGSDDFSYIFSTNDVNGFPDLGIAGLFLAGFLMIMLFLRRWNGKKLPVVNSTAPTSPVQDGNNHL